MDLSNKYQCEFVRFRHILGYQKFPEYLKWMKERFPNKDLHHIFGSVRGNKFTDAFVIPIDHEFHLRCVEYAKSYYCFIFLKESVAYFLLWLKKTIPQDDNIQRLFQDYEPETLKALVEYAYNLTGDQRYK
jgi:hypothetical protein